MQVIIDFLSGIGEMIVTAFEWLISTVQDLAYVATMLTQFIAAVPGYFTWLPEEVLTLVVVGIGIAGVYKLLGREG